MAAKVPESDDDDEEEYDEEEEEDEARKVQSYHSSTQIEESSDDYDDDDDDEDDEEEEEEAGGVMSSMMGRLFGTAEPDHTEADDDADFPPPGSEEEEEEDRGVDANFAQQEPPLVEEEEDDEEGDDFEKEAETDREVLERLELAYKLATKGHVDEMRRDQFRQALATMGKVFTKEEADEFFQEACAFQHDETSVRSSGERDERGWLKRTTSTLAPKKKKDDEKTLKLRPFQKYYLKFLTRSVATDEAEAHFRAIVEGAAQRALQQRHPDSPRPRALHDRRAIDAGQADHAASRAERDLEKMANSKHLPVSELFVYARDLRRVLVTYAEKLTDEEADQLIRECRPAPKRGAGDGGLDRVYFTQYLTMLRDETL
eukprot:CAMPEP_0118898340 /NCGR_PEP_ID=MMETSP1166-20130328/5370_1 /TAXON_ID=1104430 /ORGANISM="Chrysoreinhardia sp, Strain CCMP3193" /LENGTH=372 /DNA_ID=CAMNT_0006837443 /DNA_START=47 /DNA_END=1168 /DNA_ORIENTATION=-